MLIQVQRNLSNSGILLVLVQLVQDTYLYYRFIITPKAQLLALTTQIHSIYLLDKTKSQLLPNCSSATMVILCLSHPWAWNLCKKYLDA